LFSDSEGLSRKYYEMSYKMISLGDKGKAFAQSFLSSLVSSSSKGLLFPWTPGLFRHVCQGLAVFHFLEPRWFPVKKCGNYVTWAGCTPFGAGPCDVVAYETDEFFWC
jgi:hypothetical protein